MLSSEEINRCYRRTHGLTGVIGSGKSTAAVLFREAGCHIIDADLLAREVLSEKYSRAGVVKERITQAFGAALFKDGELDRRALGEIVFKSEDKLKQLNEIMHPEIEQLFALHVQQSWQSETEPVIIYDAPLIYEAGLDEKMASVIVVYAPEEICVERAAERSGEVRRQIRERLSLQISIEKKRESADYVIDNSEQNADLKPQVGRILALIKEKGYSRS